MIKNLKVQHHLCYVRISKCLDVLGFCSSKKGLLNMKNVNLLDEDEYDVVDIVLAELDFIVSKIKNCVFEAGGLEVVVVS